MGIDAGQMYRIAFALGVGLTAFGGAVILPYATVSPTVGGDYVVLMFTVVVLGGLGSVAGAVVGGLDGRCHPGALRTLLSHSIAKPDPVPRVYRRAGGEAARAGRSQSMKRWMFVAAALAVACILPLLLDAQGYWIRVLTFTFLFAAMAQAWNIIGGLANQTSLDMRHSSASGLTRRPCC